MPVAIQSCEKKICPKCQLGKSIDKYYKYPDKNRIDHWCKTCRNAYLRQNKQIYLGKNKTRQLTTQAITSGWMPRPKYCSNCNVEGKWINGRFTIEAHHPDYEQPYNIVWLCRSCHGAVRNGKKIIVGHCYVYEQSERT